MLLFFAHIPFVVNHTINAKPPEKLQHRFICAVGYAPTFAVNAALVASQ